MGMMPLVDDLDATYRRHADELVRYATVLVGPADAADVVAEVFAEAVASTSWHTVDNQRAYLYRAVLNRSTSLHRSGERRKRRESRVAGPDRWAAPDPSVDAQRVLAQLPAQQRAVVFFTYWADLTPPQIAELLDIGEGTVRKQLARARATLRRVLS